MPTVLETSVQATYVLATFTLETYVLSTFVHISNISAVTDPTLTQHFRPTFFGGFNYCGPKFFEPKIFFWLFFNFFFRLKYFCAQIFFQTQNFFIFFLRPKFFSATNSFSDKKKFRTNNFFDLIFFEKCLFGTRKLALATRAKAFPVSLDLNTTIKLHSIFLILMKICQYSVDDWRKKIYFSVFSQPFFIKKLCCRKKQ